MRKPVVAATFGDASGIGPELVAKLLNRPEALAAARIILVGDAWVWAQGQRIAGTATLAGQDHPGIGVREARDNDAIAPMLLDDGHRGAIVRTTSSRPRSPLRPGAAPAWR